MHPGYTRAAQDTTPGQGFMYGQNAFPLAIPVK
jgi:hypothetical protein